MENSRRATYLDYAGVRKSVHKSSHYGDLALQNDKDNYVDYSILNEHETKNTESPWRRLCYCMFAAGDRRRTGDV
jgi:hypothetical protein